MNGKLASRLKPRRSSWHEWKQAWPATRAPEGKVFHPVHRLVAARYSKRQPILRTPEFFPMANATDDRLRLLIERVERLEEEKKGIADDIRDVYAEAKAVGYDAKIMRQIVKLRKMKPDDRAEMEAILDTYKAAL